MKKIEIEDDVYQYIASHTLEIGEPATSILRRLLDVPREPGSGAKPPASTPLHELATLLSEPTFTRSTTAVSRMLRILKEVYKQHPADFHKVEKISGGRNRIYFANNERKILESGESTQPREIDGTGWWVMTNSPTPMKRQLVREVLRTLGYSPTAIEAATNVIQ